MVGRSKSSRSLWPWQGIWISDIVTSSNLYFKKLFWLLCENSISITNNGSKEETVAEVIAKYDYLSLDDSSGSGEHKPGCVLEVEMAVSCNECGR